MGKSQSSKQKALHKTWVSSCFFPRTFVQERGVKSEPGRKVTTFSIKLLPQSGWIDKFSLITVTLCFAADLLKSIIRES